MSDEALRKHMALQQANQHNHKTPSRPVEDNTAPAAIKSIDDTFTRLKAICVVGSAFKTPQEEHIVKQEWMLALREEGVIKQFMIDDGIEFFRVKSRKAKGATWFPSIGEFIDACVGSDDTLERAVRAYEIFSNPKWQEKQICNIGLMVVAKHKFALKEMKAAEGKKRFIELYLEFASNNEFKLLDAFALTETVQLTKEQQKDADNRKLNAQNQCMDSLHGMFGRSEPKEQVKPVKTGVTIGKPKSTYKTPKQLDDERERQLAMIKTLTASQKQK